ncbi:unnamed protein product, partial [Cladocopium goreaui]
MEVNMNGFSGFLCTLNCSKAHTVGDLKAEIECSSGISCIEQKLVCCGEDLEDERLLGSLIPADADAMEVDMDTTTTTLELSLIRVDARRAQALHDVRCNGLCLETLSEDLRNDRDIVLAAVKHNGFAVIHAHPELRRDPEIALAAVSDRGFVLRYLEDALKAGE